MVPKLDNEVPPSVNTSTPALVNLTWVSNGFILAPNDEEAFCSAVTALATPMAPETDDDAAPAALAFCSAVVAAFTLMEPEADDDCAAAN